ncbi:MAG TPA: alpha-2-macroglobulin family protein, partial [Chloroflexota bacterium]|nr:alpha-2-macroglobulin family protein [Chloroflexota bacterium]
SGTGAGLLDAFYGPRALSVFTADTLNVSPEQLLTRRPTGAITTARGQGFGGNMPVAAPARAARHMVAQSARSLAAPGIPVRSHFADTAYWNAAVVTDAQGVAVLSVPLPDNLTTWQILGQGVTADTLVGAGTAQVIATKDLILRPLLPRFFALGDQARIGATVNNTTAVARTVRLRLALANGRTTVVGAVRTIRLAAGAETDVTWPVTVTALGSATVRIEAIDVRQPTTNDAVQVTLPVQENSTPEVVADAGEAGAATHEDVRIPTGIEPDEGNITLILEPTLAAGLRVGADFLRSYPYDSSIDLAARSIGDAELGRLPARAAVLDAHARGALRPAILRQLAQLYPMQHQDGGFGWWIDDPSSSPSITAYVVEALAGVRDLGYPVNPTVLDRAVSYLISNAQSPSALNASVGYDAELQAEIVYAATLAGRGKDVSTLADQLFDVRGLLGRAGAARLAMALHAQHTPVGEGDARTLLADLTSAAALSATGAHWDEPAYDWRALDSDIATTATVLEALMELDPHSPLLAGAVRWLMAARKVTAWESTTATAAALRGLVAYILASGELNGDYRYTVRRNGAPWAVGSVSAASLTGTRTLVQQIGPRAPAGSTQRLLISRQGAAHSGSLHYMVQLRYFLPVNRLAPAGSGVQISRRYLTPDGRSGLQGATVRVQLTVTAPQDLFYLTVEDPLPAGAESVDGSLRTTSQLAQIENQSTIPRGSDDLTWYVTHTDLRDNRTMLFLDFLPAGVYQYTYLIHLTTAGTYHALPARIGETYFPEVFARGQGTYFQIR